MKNMIIRFLVFVMIVISIIFIMNQYKSNIENDSLKYLENSIDAAINSCYGTEGKYPADLEYLIKNYGIIVNNDSYIVFYETFGSNIRPNIKIIKRD